MLVSKLYYRTFQFSPVIPLAYALRNFSKLDAPQRWFVGYLASSLVLTIVMTVLARNGMNTLWLMNLSLPIYAFWILAMFALWEPVPALRRVMRIAVVVFVLVWACEVTMSGVLFEFTTFSRPLLNALFIGASCRTIYEANKSAEHPLLDQPQFWMSAGILLYYGGMIGVNLASQSLLKSSQDALFSALLIQPALSLAAHLMYLAGFRTQCRR
jgi:hypothetical protein